MGELSVVARGQPCLLVGDFTLVWQNEISAGLCVDFEEAWALAAGLQPAPSCNRDLGATGGRRGDFVVGCPLAAAGCSFL